MNQFTLKTKWVALAFAVLTLFTAYVVTGSRSEDSASDASAPEGDATQVAQANAEVPPPPTQDAEDQPQFVDDDSLIDDAGGDDPSPPDELNDGGDGGDGGDDLGDDDFGPANQSPSVVPQGKAPDGTPIVIQK